nr:peptidase domain-containing ABC transporter [Patulibacter sp. SYSU D01012]
MQQSPNECGAACLAMAMCGLGRPTTIEECLEHVGGGRDGASGRGLVEAARRLGAVATAFRVAGTDLSELETPAIVHWEFDHFLLVERATPRWIDVIDPGSGRRRMSAEEFSDGFTGIVITVAAGASIDPTAPPTRDSRREFLRLALRAPGVRALVVQLVVAAVLLQALALVPPFAIKLVLDTVVPQGLDDAFGLAAVAIGALFLGQLAAGLARAGILLALEARVDTQVTMSAFDHVLSLPHAFFDRRSAGDTVMRLMSTASIRQILGTQSLGALLDGLVAIGYCVVLFLIDPTIAAVATALAALQVAVTLVAAPRLAARIDLELVDQARAQSALVETVSEMATIKATGSEARALERFAGLFATGLRSGLRRSQLAATVEAVNGAVRLAAPLVVIWFAARAVLADDLSAGTMVALAIVSGLLINGASSGAAAVSQLQLGRGMVDRLVDLLRQAPEQRIEERVAAPALRGEVELRDVTVRYSPDGPPALQGVSLRIPAGRKVAIVGPSGSGKTTLARTILGLVEAEEGTVRFDGVDADDLELTSVRGQFGVVLQDTALFDGTIRDNIRFHDPDASDARVREAASRANILDEVLRFPMGLDTRVSEGGSSLSGGQRQRLALARALLREPRLLILDEATSHLDALSEAAVHRLLGELECTRIVIAHRLSTVRDADEIVVLHAGRVAERGTHDELLAARGVYAQLLGLQVEADRTAAP